MKACEVEDATTVDAWAKGLPAPQEGEYTVYGAAWCPWCRKAKIVFEISKSPFKFIDCDEYGGPNAVKDALKGRNVGAIPPDYRSIPLVYGQDAKFIGGFDATLESFGGSVSMEEVNHRAMASEVHYNKNSNNVTLRQDDSADWKLDPEAMVATRDGSSLKLHVQMTNAEASGIRLFVVCDPPKRPDGLFQEGWIQVGATQKSIAYPGRHYIKSYDGSTIDKVLKASKSMRVYVVWLSTEPYDPDAVS